MTPSPESTEIVANLDRWAELTALVLDLRKSLLPRGCSEAEAEHRVWSELRELKEKAWTRSPS